MNTVAAEWYTPDKLPPESDDPCFGTESIRVLGYTKYCRMAVVYCRQWGEEDEELDPIKWYTTCSDGWEITDKLLYWTFLPQAPK
jgi:hypothetical protein